MKYAMQAASRCAAQPAGTFRRRAIATGIALALACTTALPVYAQKVELGPEATAGPDGTAIGAHTEATGDGATALGIYAKAIASQATAVGRNAQARAVSSLALGAGAIVEATAVGSVALGAGSTATGLSLGTAAYLVGGTATAEVAIGGRRITGLAAGANPNDAATVGQLQALTRNAVEYTDINDRTLVVLNRNIDGTAGASTRITNLKAGDVADGSTDAINGDQLFDLKNTPMTFAGNTGTTSVKLDETFTIQGGAPVAGGVSGRNITTRITGNTLDVLMSESPGFGGVTVNAAGTGRITGVADGELVAGGTDAVNAGQLHEVDVVARKGWNLSANGATAEHIAPGETVDIAQGSNAAVTRSGNTVTVGVVPDPTFTGRVTTDGGLTIGAGGLTVAAGQTLDMGNNVLANVAAGTSTLHAVNVGQLTALGDDVAAALGGASAFDASTQALTTALNVGSVTYDNVNDALGALNATANRGWNLQVGGVTENVAPGDTIGLVNGTNTVASYDEANNELKVSVVDAPTFAGKVTAEGGLTVTGGDFIVAGGQRVDVGGNAIDRVGAGTIDAASGQAVNGAQVFGISESLAQALGGGASVANDGSVTTPAYALSNANAIAGTTGDATSVGGGFDKVDAALGALQSSIGDITQGNAGIRYFHVDSTRPDSEATGAEAIAIGPEALATQDHAVALGAGTEAAGLGSLALGSAAHASAEGSVALGQGASATLGNSVALGSGAVTSEVVGTAGTVIDANAYAFAGAAPAGTVSVGSAGRERTITHLAAGRVDADSTDAINGSQLHATNQAIEAIGSVAGNADELAVKYGWTDANGDGVASVDEIDYGSVAMSGPQGTRVSNVAPARLAATSMDAVNGAQLFQSMEQVASLLGGGASMTSQGLAAPSYLIQGVDYHDVGAALEALDIHVTLLGGRPVGTQLAGYTHGRSDSAHPVYGDGGPGSTALGLDASAAGVENAVAIGQGATVAATRGTAVGQAASVTADNAVALGQGSVADRADTVSVGSAGNERQIANVAAGTQATDAVNKGQLDRGVVSANGYTDARVNALSDSFDVFRNNVGEELHRQDRRIDRQGAMSAAMMNMAMSAAGIHTQNRAAVGVGFQGGESAMSLGYQRALSERATITFGGAFSSDDQAVGFGAGVGW